MNNKAQIKALSILIFIFSFLLYSNTISHQYAIDDSLVVKDHPIVTKGIKGIPETFTTHFIVDKGQRAGYRPVLLSIFAIEYELFGQDPNVSHFINVTLYALTCVFLFILLASLLSGYNIIFPFITTLFFAAHPLHTEVVANIKGRDEILFFLFMITSIWFFTKYFRLKNNKFILPGLLFWALAVLTKGTYFTFFAVFFLIFYFFTNGSIKKITILTGIIAILTLTFIISWFTFFSSTTREYNFIENPLITEDFFTRLATGFYVMGYYLKLLIIPHPLQFFYGYNEVPVVEWSNILVILSVITFISLAVYAFRLFPSKNIYSFIILFTGFYLLVFSNIVLLSPGLVAERFMYHASLGFCLLLALLILKLGKVPLHQVRGIAYNKTTIMITTAILLLYSVKTFSRNKAWKNMLTLAEHDEKHSSSFNVHRILASQYIEKASQSHFPSEKNELQLKAIKKYKEALEIYPRSGETLSYLGTIFLQRSNPQKAFEYYKKAIKIAPSSAIVNYNMGFYYTRTQSDALAKPYLIKALKNDPHLPEAYSRLSWVYYRQDSIDKAIQTDLIAIKKGAIKDFIYDDLAKFYFSKGNYKNALYYWQQALKLNPQDPEYYKRLAQTYSVMGDNSKAAYYKDQYRRMTQSGKQ